MSSIPPDYFIHAANLLFLVSYSVRDILWLRLFAVAGSLVCIPYYLLQPTVLWAPLAWGGASASNPATDSPRTAACQAMAAPIAPNPTMATSTC